eukprot:UN12766
MNVVGFLLSIIFFTFIFSKSTFILFSKLFEFLYHFQNINFFYYFTSQIVISFSCE